MKEMMKTMADICHISGVSGDEHRVRDYIIEQIKDFVSYEIDPIGNLIAFKKGVNGAGNKKMMMSAHMDEVGFIVTAIDDKGLLSFTNVGGIDARIVLGKTVRINDINGVIGAKPVHLQSADEKNTPIKIDKLYIDIGADTKEQAEKLICIGDRICWNSEFLEFGEGFIKGKALDDRAGCVMMMELIKSDIEYDCYFAFTCSEEAGVMGATTAVYTVNPDVAVVVETTTAADIGGVEKMSHVCRLGSGPVVSFMDKGTIYNQHLYKQVRSIADQNNIPNQTKEGVYGGNESRVVQRSRGGVKVTAVSLPCRYLHTPSCVLQKTDIQSTIKLLNLLIGELVK